MISSALDIADSAQGRGRLHEMLDQRGAAATITSLAHARLYAARRADGIARAFAAFAAGRPRPAYLELPLDLLKQPAGDGWDAHRLPGQPQPAPSRHRRQPRRSCSAAKQPGRSLWAAARSMPAAEALAIAEKLGARSSPPPPARASCRQSIRSASATAWRRTPGQKLLREADVILCRRHRTFGDRFLGYRLHLRQAHPHRHRPGNRSRARIPPRSPSSPMRSQRSRRIAAALAAAKDGQRRAAKRDRRSRRCMPREPQRDDDVAQDACARCWPSSARRCPPRPSSPPT